MEAYSFHSLGFSIRDRFLHVFNFLHKNVEKKENNFVTRIDLDKLLSLLTNLSFRKRHFLIIKLEEVFYEKTLKNENKCPILIHLIDEAFCLLQKETGKKSEDLLNVKTHCIRMVDIDKFFK
jgi:hypothetical protein